MSRISSLIKTGALALFLLSAFPINSLSQKIEGGIHSFDSCQSKANLLKEKAGLYPKSIFIKKKTSKFYTDICQSTDSLLRLIQHEVEQNKSLRAKLNSISPFGKEQEKIVLISKADDMLKIHLAGMNTDSLRDLVNKLKKLNGEDEMGEAYNRLRATLSLKEKYDSWKEPLTKPYDGASIEKQINALRQNNDTAYVCDLDTLSQNLSRYRYGVMKFQQIIKDINDEKKANKDAQTIINQEREDIYNFIEVIPYLKKLFDKYKYDLFHQSPDIEKEIQNIEKEIQNIETD